jgi:hypothetical protein
MEKFRKNFSIIERQEAYQQKRACYVVHALYHYLKQTMVDPTKPVRLDKWGFPHLDLLFLLAQC